jgi:CRISPR-associated protein Cmr4
MMDLAYLYLLSPLHTGGTTQEGNLVGIARESHTNLPYIPSSTIRGKIRSLVTNSVQKVRFFGPELQDLQDEDFLFEYEYENDRKITQLEQGNIWIGDGSILWLPVPSFSHGVIWISCPLLLQRWARFNSIDLQIDEYSSNLSTKSPVYLKDAIIKGNELKPFLKWEHFIPQENSSIKRVLVLPDQHCSTLIQMSLWRQVKINLDENKTVQGGFRYEEAIPPDTLMYFPWGITAQSQNNSEKLHQEFTALLTAEPILQIGGQESLGRGFVQQWLLNKSD